MKMVAALGRQIDVSDWIEKNLAGSLPGRGPYGLGRLIEQGWQLQPIADEDAGLMSTVKSYVIALSRALNPAAGTGVVAVAWDEQRLSSLLTRVGWSNVCVGTGLIWITEEPAGVGERLRRWAKCVQLKGVDYAWVLSEAQLPAARQLLGKHKLLEVISFGVDIDFFRPSSSLAAQTVISFGNDRHRDVDLLRSALQFVRLQAPDTHFVVQTSMPEAFPDWVETHRTMSHASLRDYIQDAAVALICTKPNLHVSGMTAALESQACGTPVVMTATPGSDRYVRDGVTGHLVPLNDPATAANKVVELLVNSQRRQTMAQNGRTFVERHHSDANVAHQLSQLSKRAAESRANSKRLMAKRRDDK